MRFLEYIFEEGNVGGNVGAGGEGYVDSTPATTTKNIEPFYNKIGSAPARRKKKRKKHLFQPVTNEHILSDLYNVFIYNKLNEGAIKDTLFNNIKLVGSKLGLKVKKAESLFDYIASGEKEMFEFFNLICLYLLANNSSDRNSISNEIRTSFKKINKKRFTAFIMQLDKVSFGLTSIVRHILMSLTGIEITTYNTWEKDINYIISQLDKVRKVLLEMGPTDEEIKAFDGLYNIITRTKYEIESSKGL